MPDVFHVAEVGDFVIICKRFVPTRLGRIDRVTRTQVVTDTGSRFSRKTGRMIGAVAPRTTAEPYDGYKPSHAALQRCTSAREALRSAWRRVDQAKREADLQGVMPVPQAEAVSESIRAAIRSLQAAHSQLNSLIVSEDSDA